MKRSARNTHSKALFVIIGLLLVSGALRLGGIGLAVANEADEVADAIPDQPVPGPQVNTEALLQLISKRTAELDAKEKQLRQKSQDLNAAQLLIEQNLKRMAEAEAALEATIARVDGAAETDLSRLTSVYESMKPKVASELFEQMAPEFAAGFLARMSPQGAANIMTNLSSEAGYAISVVLAGRHVKTPTE